MRLNRPITTAGKFWLGYFAVCLLAGACWLAH